MEFLVELWLPIVLTGVVLFIASFLNWTILPTHRGDWGKVPKEDELLDAMRAFNLPEGRYSLPYTGNKEDWASDEFKAKWEKGPRGTLNLWPDVGMGGNLAKTFIYFLVVTAFIAYLASFAFRGGTPEYLDVFRFVGTSAFLVYVFGGMTNAFWFRWPIVGNVIDGIIYSLLSAGIFGWLWPA